jgi:hypothetical protein
MSQSSQDPSLLPLWIAAIVAALGVIGAFVKRFLNTVTRAELREAIKDSNDVIDQRHAENLARLKAQDEQLIFIRGAVGRIEGQISGRYPAVKR